MSEAAEALNSAIYCKSIVKKTRRGKVVRLIREKYVQRDVGYGYIGRNKIDADALVRLVSSAPHKHLLIADTNVLLQQIDVFEQKCPATSLLVVMQTVLQELRGLSLAVYRRVMALMKDESKSFIFYPNEHATDSVAYRHVDETDNDFNDRLIRRGALVFHQALCDYHSDDEEEEDDEDSDDDDAVANADDSKKGYKKQGDDVKCKAILLTNDVANRKRAEAEGLVTMSVHKYIRRHWQAYPEICDLLSAGDDQDLSDHRSPDLFPTYVSLSDILAGIRSRKYHRCILRSSGRPTASGAECWTECYAIIHKQDGQRVSIAVQGRENVNRALDGDVVAIEIIEEAGNATLSNDGNSLNKASAAGVGEVNQGTLEASTAMIEGLSVAAQGTQAAVALKGRVVGIIRRNWKQYAGSLIPFSDSPASKTVVVAIDDAAADDDMAVSEKALFVPLDNKLPRVVVSTRRLKQLLTQRVLVNIDSWPTNSPYPLGHFVRSFGAYGSKDVETAVLLHEYEVPHDAFTPAVMACLPPSDWRITEDIVSQRTDLRHLPVVSVDPPGCKDIDDALHCRRLPNGNFEVGVHIADVGYFVDPGSPLDVEAQHRSTSTYLVERRLDMLPGYLTTQLCSLRCKEDHLAFSVIWEMDANANIIDVSFCKSVIHSIASLSYGEAQAILDDPSRGGEMCESLRQLNRLAKQLGQRRREAGALSLASSEVRFQFSDDSADPTDVTSYELKESNSMVEEWMLIANITVAKKILRHYPTLSILRRHQPPSKQQFAPLLAAAQAVGVSLVIDSSKTLADSLDAATRTDDPMFNKLLRMLSTRCMQPAQYFCSGELPKDQWHHYGLATPVYTHFTSPIRRYADLLVHRLLAAAINVTSLPVQNADRSRQHDICTHMNRRHKAAQYIQRDSTKLHTLLYFRKNSSSENAYILTVAKDRFNVIIPKFGVESAIEISSIVRHVWQNTMSEKKLKRVDNAAYNDGYVFDEDRYTISICSDPEHSGIHKTYRVFDKVQVKISVSEESSDGAPQRTLVIELIDDAGVAIKNVPMQIPTASPDESTATAVATKEAPVTSKGVSTSTTSATDSSSNKKRKVESNSNSTPSTDKKKGKK